MEQQFAREVLALVSQELEIPQSHYKRATDRYASLGRWLERPESRLAQLEPRTYSQGSFRLGTVVRPLDAEGEYDLDLVSELALTDKGQITQRELKELVGTEVAAYAEANSMKSSPEEKKRCWHLDYADEINFHMDILPAIPLNENTRQALSAVVSGEGEDGELASFAIAITDRTHPSYAVIDRDWPHSNPRGYARWFGGRMRDVALPSMRNLVRTGVYARVSEVPVYAWKTPLQLSIQILKRHRDVMFRRAPRRKPISIILTTLAARAYQGETDLIEALGNLVDRIPDLVRPRSPRIPNPVDPGEDFADRWTTELGLEEAFQDWVSHLRADLQHLLQGPGTTALSDSLERKFALRVPEDRLPERPRPEAAVTVAPAVRIPTNPRPWRYE